MTTTASKARVTRSRTVKAKAEASVPQVEATSHDTENPSELLKEFQASAASGVSLAIVREQDEASAYINQTIKNYLKSGYEVHVAWVTAIWHACVHGSPALLNRLYAALRSNDQAAARLFLRRAHAIIGLNGEKPDGQDADIIRAAVKAGETIGFEKGTFFVPKDNMKNRRALQKLCETRFINPMGDDKFFMQRNNVQEVRTIGDVEAVDSVIRTLKGYLGESTDRRKYNLTDSVRKVLQKTLDGFESLKTQVSTN